MTVDRVEDFQALEPFCQVVEDGLAGLVDGGHFFDSCPTTSSSSSQRLDKHSIDVFSTTFT